MPELHDGFEVYKDGERVEDFTFVLRPGKDYAAWMAMQSYAVFCKDENLAQELMEKATEYENQYSYDTSGETVTNEGES